MSFIVIIPARYQSTRLPGKPLLDIGGKSMIQHVVDRANESEADRVIVATDDARIEAALRDSNCEVGMTRSDHRSGSDRLAEVVQNLALDDTEIVVNVQGDEPFVPARLINLVAAALARSTGAAMATAAHRIESEADFNDRNVVKVVFDQKLRAMYFSRAPIPHAGVNLAWRHVGIYAYRAGFLRRYEGLTPSPLEQQESLEQLRVLDNGEVIMVEPVEFDPGPGIDTEADLQRARERVSGGRDD